MDQIEKEELEKLMVRVKIKKQIKRQIEQEEQKKQIELMKRFQILKKRLSIEGTIKLKRKFSWVTRYACIKN